MTLPRVTLKIATSLDGRIALADGTSQWITSSQSRARGHDLRAAHAAIIVGVNTVLADDPLLTARTVPMPKTQPVRIVADSQGRTPAQTRLVQSVSAGRVVIATAGAAPEALVRGGVEVWACGKGARTDVRELVRRAGSEGLDTLLLEGGGTLAASFLRAGLVDQIAWFRAPILIGGDGLAAIGGLGLMGLAAATRWRPVSTEPIGDDVLDTYVRIEH
jgi:diaminohydroxyphosphoribosylaminopyrimidine deaminase / 5-amino-6-(5-phosphoribosylamino)uracil reductase